MVLWAGRGPGAGARVRIGWQSRRRSPFDVEGRQNPSCAGRREASGAVCTLAVAPRTVVASGSGFGGEFDLVFFLFEKCWKIVQWQKPWMGSTFLPKTPSSRAELWLPHRLTLNHLWRHPQGEGRGRKSLSLGNCLKFSVPLWRYPLEELGSSNSALQDLLQGAVPLAFLGRAAPWRVAVSVQR